MESSECNLMPLRLSVCDIQQQEFPVTRSMFDGWREKDCLLFSGVCGSARLGDDGSQRCKKGIMFRRDGTEGKRTFIPCLTMCFFGGRPSKSELGRVLFGDSLYFFSSDEMGT